MFTDDGQRMTDDVKRTPHASRCPHQPPVASLRPGLRSQSLARHAAVGLAPRPQAAGGAVAAGPGASQHLGGRAPHRLLEVHRASTAGARCNALVPTCGRSEEHTSELQSPCNLVCRLLLEKKKSKEC